MFLTKVLVDLLVDQVRKGNRLNNAFNKKAWVLLCDDFYKKTGLRWDKEQLKNRFAVLRRQYVVVKSLLDLTDFSWDESTGMVMGKDEAWTEYIKVHPDAESIRTSGCPIYGQLCTIFSEPATNGKHEISVELEEEKEENPSSLPCAETLTMIPAESSSEYEEVDDMADNQGTNQPTAPGIIGNRKRGRKGIDDAIAGAMLEMAAASKLRTAAVKQLNARFPIADCVKELDELKGVDEHVYFGALDLFDNPSSRETFLSLKRNKRLAWLQWKCSASSNTLH